MQSPEETFRIQRSKLWGGAKNDLKSSIRNHSSSLKDKLNPIFGNVLPKDTFMQLLVSQLLWLLIFYFLKPIFCMKRDLKKPNFYVWDYKKLAFYSIIASVTSVAVFQLYFKKTSKCRSSFCQA